MKTMCPGSELSEETARIHVAKFPLSCGRNGFVTADQMSKPLTGHLNDLPSSDATEHCAIAI